MNNTLFYNYLPSIMRQATKLTMNVLLCDCQLFYKILNIFISSAIVCIIKLLLWSCYITNNPPILSGLQPPAFLSFGSVDLLQFGLRQTVVWELQVSVVVTVILSAPKTFRAISSYRNGLDERPMQIVRICLKPWLVSNALKFHWLKQSHLAKLSINGVEKYTPRLMMPYSV